MHDAIHPRKGGLVEKEEPTIAFWERLFGGASSDGDWEPQRLLTALGDEGSRPYVLDVRTEGEFRQGHLPGAQLVPLARLGSVIESLPRERTIVCVCHSGHRSAVAAAALRRAGLQAVSLLGGMICWTGPVRR